MSLAGNLKFTLRILRRNPALAISAILATGLGIGATSAMFSIADGILLHPLPFPKSDRLVNVWETAAARNIPRMVAARRQVSELPTLRPLAETHRASMLP